MRDFGLSTCQGTLNVSTSEGHQVNGNVSFTPIFKMVNVLIGYTYSTSATIAVTAPPAQPNKKVGLRTWDQKLSIITTFTLTKVRYIDEKGNVGAWKPTSQNFSESNTANGPPQQQGYWVCCGQ